VVAQPASSPTSTRPTIKVRPHRVRMCLSFP
jgi:hypothetical protein